MTPTGLLACSVRACGRALELGERVARCPAGHAFDRARSGYWNLLQPQDRRSLAAGDDRAAVAARARGIERGLGAALLDQVQSLLSAQTCSGPLLELGSGSGDFLAPLRAGRREVAIGLDLSVAAVEHAARRFPEPTWVVANADRRLPLLDGSIAWVQSIHGRRNPAECARVLAPGGRALFAVPAPDDLCELREALHGEAHVEVRLTALLREVEPHLRPIERGQVRRTHTLDRTALDDLLRGTYRGQRMAARARLDDLDALSVTLASDWLLCEQR